MELAAECTFGILVFALLDVTETLRKQPDTLGGLKVMKDIDVLGSQFFRAEIGSVSVNKSGPTEAGLVCDNLS